MQKYISIKRASKWYKSKWNIVNLSSSTSAYGAKYDNGSFVSNLTWKIVKFILSKFWLTVKRQKKRKKSYTVASWNKRDSCENFSLAYCEIVDSIENNSALHFVPCKYAVKNRVNINIEKCMLNIKISRLVAEGIFEISLINKRHTRKRDRRKWLEWTFSTPTTSPLVA